MSHRRQQIRAAVVAAVTGLASTGNRVTAGLVYPEQTADLPALNVLTPTETRQEAEAVMGWADADMGNQFRNLELTIEGRASGAGVLDTLDQVALEIETAIGVAGTTLGDLCQWLFLASTETELTNELEEPAGLIRLTYQVTYRVDPNDPQ